MESYTVVNTLARTISRKFPDGKTVPLAFVNGFVTIRGVKLYTLKVAMDLMGITRPTFYKWVKDGRIKRGKIEVGPIGMKDRWVVSEDEIKRIKAIIKEGWVRGKSKLSKPTRKKK